MKNIFFYVNGEDIHPHPRKTQLVISYVVVNSAARSPQAAQQPVNQPHWNQSATQHSFSHISTSYSATQQLVTQWPIRHATAIQPQSRHSSTKKDMQHAKVAHCVACITMNSSNLIIDEWIFCLHLFRHNGLLIVHPFIWRKVIFAILHGFIRHYNFLN